MDKIEIYNGICQDIMACSKCGLGCNLLDGHNPRVAGQGNLGAKVMFMAKGPGLQETIFHQPLTKAGKSGEMYEKVLDFLQLARDNVYTTNTVHCRPPKNRDPMPYEVLTCGQYVKREIELIKPNIIITFGRFAACKFLLDFKMTKDHGKLCYSDEVKINIYPLYHPAYVQCYASKDKRMEFKTDIKNLKDILTKEGILETK